MNEIKKENSPNLAEFKEVSENDVICPNCNAIMDYGDKFCGKCGTKLIY